MYEDIAEVLVSASQIALKNSVLLAVHAFNVGVAKKGPPFAPKATRQRLSARGG